MKEINVKVIYNEKLVKKYMIDHFFIKSMLLRFITNVALFLFLIFTFIDKKVSDLELLIIFILLFLFIELNTSILPRKSFKKIKKIDETIINSKNNFTFTNKKIKVKTDYAVNEIGYDEINSCVEVKNAYYIYINANQAFIINKDDIKHTDKDRLDKLLKSKIENYKVSKK